MLSANSSQVSNDVKYIEDVCSVYLRTGTGSSQTVTTGIKENTGALVISKSRSAATDWAWYDTFRGATYDLVSNSTAAQTTQAQGLTSFNADGHTWGTLAKVNTSGATYVDTVLKPTPKFFDVVTYTGNGANGRQIAHSLGSTPGCVIVKRTDTSGTEWLVYHRSVTASAVLVLNTTDSAYTSSNYFNTPSSTYFSVQAHAGLNASGGTYVAYLFAHNAGGFGLTGTDNVISCGSYTGNATAGNAITLGYEPQWIMIKQASGSDAGTNSWSIYDNMRGMPNGSSNDNRLEANNSNAEVGYPEIAPTATGFICEATGGRLNASGGTYIYIAIRRGPMKVPTDATKVFLPQLANTSAPTYRASFTIDMVMALQRTGGSPYIGDRLRGAVISDTTSTAAEAAYANEKWDYQTSALAYASGPSYEVGQCFRRAPSFFDEVCYTGTGVSRTVNHNLQAVPELMIVKNRDTAQHWAVYVAPVGNTSAMLLNLTNVPGASINYWNNTTPTSSVFSVGPSANTGTTAKYVAYLFATCAGVSKVGSYTGTGTTQTINCGFTAGSRFVLVKATSTTGDWIVVDTARGLVSGNDPTLLLNSTAAEVTTNDWFDPYSAGFELSNAAGNLANTSGTEYIYFAVA